MNKSCGNCQYQRDSDLTKNGPQVRCMLDNKWRNNDYTCKKWIEIYPQLTTEQRLKIAMQFKEKTFRIKLCIVSFLGGIIATLISQIILQLWNK